MLRLLPTAALVFVLLLTVGCDSTESDPPAPFFKATLHDDRGATASLEGTAVLNPGSFDQELFFTLPAEWIGDDMHVTVIHLIASDGETEHTIGFSHISDDRPASGEELSIEPQVFSRTFGKAPSSEQEGVESDDEPAWLDTLNGKTFASYQRTSSDSLFTYLPASGTLHVERASDREVAGTFAVEIAARLAFPLDEWPPHGAGTFSAPDDFPGRIEYFADPLVLEGSFTAVLPK